VRSAPFQKINKRSRTLPKTNRARLNIFSADFSSADVLGKGSMTLERNSWIQSLVTRCEKQPQFGWICAILWVALVTFVAFWLHLGSIGLVDETEPLFAEAARQMTVTGDWITPYFNGVTRFDKPALVYWMAAIA